MSRNLSSRSESSELEERGIIPKTDSALLAGRMVELEHNMRKDTVHRELEHRSEREELEERNVLRMYNSLC